MNPHGPRHRETRPLILGIAGGTASGKSWLAAYLARHLGSKTALVIAQDRYYRCRASLPPAARDNINFDLSGAFENALLVSHLRWLRQGREVHLPIYNFRTHSREPRKEPATPRPLIIVEGLFVLAVPGLRRQLDISVYADCPADIRLARRIMRDVRERGRSAQEIVHRYLRHARPAHERYIEPSREFASKIWNSETDRAFPKSMLQEIRTLLRSS